MKWKKTTETFINPYNFIELNGECKREKNGIENRKSIKDENNNRLMTGVINCTLISKTPIFIPNTTNDESIKSQEKEHKSYDFFSYNDISKKVELTENPIIPGSSVRGVIRSVYEALTDSCFGVVDNERTLYKRMPNLGDAGIVKIVNSKLALYTCDVVKIRYKEDEKKKIKCFYEELKDVEDGSKIWVKGNKTATSVSLSKTNEDYAVYLIKGNDSDNKKYYTGFKINNKDNKLIKFLNKDKDFDKLKELLALYSEERINQKYKDKEHNGYKEYEKVVDKFIKGEIIELPVYYKKYDDLDEVYISPACITKEVYRNSLNEILEDMGKYNTCTDRTNLCEACNMFGMISDSGGISSKIRFTDGSLKEGQTNVFGKMRTLKELLSPRISASEFYLKKNEDDDIWTYDYSGKWKEGKLAVSKGYKPKIRGRKFYWNHKGDSIKTAEESNLNVTVRPVNSNKEFEFKVYFERVTEKELLNLLWTLSLGDNKKDSSMQHKIGMGKPIGLGSVKIVVDSINERIVDLDSDEIYCVKERMDLLDKMNDSIFENSKESLNAIKIAFDAKVPNGNIDYPEAKIIKDGKAEIAGYGWFMANRDGSNEGDSAMKPKIVDILPNITDKKLSLNKYEEVPNKGKKLKNNGFRR